MTLSTTIQLIDENYPIYGVSNDSQGFRNNFSNIKTSLTLISDTLNSVVLNSSPTVNFNGNTLQNFKIQNAFTVAISEASTQSSNIAIDVISAGAEYFKYKIGNNINLSISNWPSSGKYVKVLLELVSNGTSNTVTVTSSASIRLMSPLSSAVLSTPSTLNQSSLYEIWTVDGGQTINIRKVGDIS